MKDPKDHEMRLTKVLTVYACDECQVFITVVEYP